MFVKTLTTSSSMFQATKLKTCTQQLKHEKYRNQANQEQLQPFFMMSPSDLSATPSSEYLQERCSRHRHWETYDNKTNLKQLQKQRADEIVSTASISVSCPLLNSSLVSVLSHIVLSENNKWTSSWQNQLFSCCHTRRIPVPLALCSGMNIRGIPDGILVSPVFEHTLKGRTLPSPSLGHDVQLVKHTWCDPWPLRSLDKVGT